MNSPQRGGDGIGDGRQGADAPARRHDYNLPLLAIFLVHCLLFQMLTAVTRLTTSYRAIELDLSYVWYGVISSGYALLPIFLAMPVGRFMSAGASGASREAQVIWTGAALALAANAGLWLYPANAPALLAFSVIAGVGHLCLMAGHQMLILRVAGPKSRESVFGWYMVVLSIGQMIGPGIVGYVAGDARLPPTQPLFAIALALSLAVMAGALLIRPARVSGGSAKAVAPMGAMDVLRLPGLKTVIIASIITVTSMDILMIYMPLMGIERGFDARIVGIALMLRSFGSIGARLFYEPLLNTAGRGGLSLWTMLLAAAGFVLLATPGPAWLVYASSILIGFGSGLAVTVCLSNVVALAPPQGRAVALTLRLSGNRLGQFVLPAAASLLAASTGAAGVFALVAAALAASGWSLRRIEIGKPGA